MHKELNVPIGLIDTSWGGTPAEFWTSRKALEANPALKPLAQGESSCLYNGMIAPLIPYAIRGAIWYQGEANVGRGVSVSHAVSRDDRQLAGRLGPGRFPLRLRADRPVPLRRAWRPIRPAAPNCGKPSG